MEEKRVDMTDTWVINFEELVEVWIRLEEARGCYEFSGKITSMKEPEWIGKWRKDAVRYAAWPARWTWKELQNEACYSHRESA